MPAIAETVKSDQLEDRSLLFSPLMIGLAAFPLLLGFILYTKEASFWGPAYPRLVALALVGFAALSAKSPVWSVPAFIIMMGPLQTFSGNMRWNLDEYPFTLISMSVWMLALFWIIRKPRYIGAVAPQREFPAIVVAALWLGMILGAVPALLAPPGASSPAVVTPLIGVTGLIEPFVLYLVVRSWLKTYNRPQLLGASLIISMLVALAAGVINFYLRQGNIAFNMVNGLPVEGEIARWRFHFMAFGGANLVGVVLCLIYPLCFLERRTGRGGSAAVSLVAAGYVWLIALASYSRATPIVLAIETALLWVWSEDKRFLSKVSVGLGTAGLLALLILPKTVVNPAVERFLSTDLVGYLLGDVKWISESDAFRNELQRSLWGEILHRPFGGYGATGLEDPESLLLDIPLQLGWIPGVLFIVLEAAMIWLGLCRLKKGAISNSNIKYFICMWIGFAIYTALTGANISKVVIDDLDYNMQVNAVSTLILVAVLAMNISALETNSPNAPIQRNPWMR